MRIRQAKRHEVEPENLERWLVSYADYMTLLFALFVVLYAFAIVNEKPFETVTDTIGKIFQQGEQILPNNQTTQQEGNNALSTNPAQGHVLGQDVSKAKPNKDTAVYSQVSTALTAAPLTSIESEVNNALFELIESGYAKLQSDGQWLEIELNSGLLFASGSGVPTQAAKDIISVIAKTLVGKNNYIRIRGYTDNDPIATEIFSSNWQLSVYRALAILQLLEQKNIRSQRLAVEGYGQYYPIADNKTAQGRAKNRRVVIAISKFGMKPPATIAKNHITTPNNAESNAQSSSSPLSKASDDDTIRVIRKANGGIIITTRNDDTKKQ